MSVLALIALSAVSTFVFGLPEATVLLYVEKYGWNIWPVAALASLGQCMSFAVLYLGGEQLMARWRWLGREVAKIRIRFANHLEQRFLVLTAFAAMFGLPPAVGLAALGGGFQVPLQHFLPVMFVGRTGRFVVIILFGKQVTAWWSHFWT